MFDSLITMNLDIFLIGKVLLLIVAGVFVGFLLKYAVRNGLDLLVLKRVFKKDASTYETALFITKILSEIVQWTIILAFANYALLLLGLELLSVMFSWLVSKSPQIITFLAIISIGLIVAKLISGQIKKKDLANREEISFISEIVIITAFGLTAIEFVGVKATALVELYKVVLYMVAVIVVVALIKPDIFRKRSKR